MSESVLGKSGSYQSMPPDPDRLRALMVGSAIGDAIGLPCENLSARRVEKRLARKGLRHGFFFGRGMVSDDTEMAVGALRAWMESGGDLESFCDHQISELRRWILTLPVGIGRATAISCLRLLINRNTENPGYSSAGNGPCTRALWLGGDLEPGQAHPISASAMLTHTDSRAVDGAYVIAMAARHAVRYPFPPDRDWVEMEAKQIADDKMSADLLRSAELAWSNEPASALLEGKKPTGYVGNTVPLALHLWLKHGPDYRGCVDEAIRLGGDTDTLAFLAGGLCAATGGTASIPQEWRHGLRDAPISMDYIEALADAAIGGKEAPKLKRLHYLWRTPVMWASVFTHIAGRAVGL